MCFPTCTASLTSTFSLIALIFDLVIFYIAKSRIDAVAGASATIGISVWLTLAAWIISGLAGCAYGVGRCCMGSRNNQQSGDPKADKGYYHQGGPDDMRMQAIRDEQLRKKEQGLPGFQEHERTPLTAGEGEDKYLHEDQQLMPGSLRRDGSVVQGVGMGYGRKNSRTPMNVQGYPRGGVDSQQGYPGGWAPQDGYGNYTDLAPVPVARRPSVASGLTSAGGAGIGAGGGGVERNEPQRYGGYYGNGQQNCESVLLSRVPRLSVPSDYDQQGYADPYQPQQVDPYPPQQYDYSAPQQYNPQQQQHHYPPQSTTPYPPQSTSPYPPQSHTPLTLANPTPIPRHVSDGHDPYTGPGSSESHYNDPGPRISHEDPYDGYDDGVGHIGMAATSPNLNEPPHQRDYTAGTFGYPDHRQYPSDRQAPLHIPTPQHLVTGPSSATNLLRSPPPSQGRDGARGGYDYDEDDEEDAGMRPPSYGQVAGGSAGYQPPRSVNEKNGYR